MQYQYLGNTRQYFGAPLAKAKKEELIWCDQTKQMQQKVYQVHTYAASCTASFKQHDKVWAEFTQHSETNMFCGGSRTMWPALVVGNWQSSELQPDGSTKTTTNFKLVFFGTCSTCYCDVDRMERLVKHELSELC